MLLSLNLLLICGKFQILYAILKVPATFIDVLNYSLKNRLGIITLDYLQLSGVMIELSRVISMQKYASTPILRMVEGILQVSFVYSCSIVLKKMVWDAYRILFRTAFWILDSWENGGSCHTTWITMTSILMNGKLQKSSRSSPGKSPTNNSFKSSAKPSQPTCSSSHFKPFEDRNCSEQNLELYLNSLNNVSDDWEVINEEVLYVDCQGLLEDDILTPSSVIRLVDIESNKPLMQVGPAVFEGHYEDTVGTYLFFDNNSTLNNTLPIEGASVAPLRKMDDQTPQHTTRYVAKSSKSLTFQRIFLKAKEGNH
uniref:TFIIIC_sub6 domain-containing protein n=1 Tax=Schistosoma mansoni TaxID=6183 RepID=A0A5K4F1T7_SCHMA